MTWTIWFKYKSSVYSSYANYWLNLQADYELRKARQTTWPDIEPRMRKFD